MSGEDIFMLCQNFEGDLDDLDSNWKASLKFDGERIMAKIGGDRIYLFNRRGYEKSKTYPEVVESLEKLEGNYLLDGEIIADSGKFNDLQKRSNLRDKEKVEDRKKEIKVRFKVFDIIEFKGKRLEKKPLKERVEYLKKINFGERVDIVENRDVKECWEETKENEEEGVIIKDMNSRYKMGKRSDSWLKLKNFKEEMFEFENEYELNNSGIKLINDKIEVQVQDNSSDRVENIKEKLDKGEKVRVVVQYLTKTKNGKLRFPSCKKVLK